MVDNTIAHLAFIYHQVETNKNKRDGNKNCRTGK